MIFALLGCLVLLLFLVLAVREVYVARARRNDRGRPATLEGGGSHLTRRD
jgi:hypothetical protein